MLEQAPVGRAEESQILQPVHATAPADLQFKIGSKRLYWETMGVKGFTEKTKTLPTVPQANTRRPRRFTDFSDVRGANKKCQTSGCDELSCWARCTGGGP